MQQIPNEDLLRVQHLGYSFGQLIGKGNYGKVFEAKYSHHDEEIPLACKHIIKRKCQQSFLIKFLPREINILKQISHPFIVKAHSVVQTPTSMFIFMRFCEKGDLLNYIKKNGIIKESMANVWFYQLASAVGYLHSLNIAHRDLKCENILISKNMNLKLADFGFARNVHNIKDPVTKMEMRELSETYCGSGMLHTHDLFGRNKTRLVNFN